MVREDILGGLKVAMSKGNSLGQAMQSFYNAGYQKEEIEEAARYLQSTPQEEIMSLKPSVPTQLPSQKMKSLPSNSPMPPKQKVSNYEILPKKKSSKTKTILTILLILILIVVILSGLWFFKDSILNLFN